MRLKDHDLSKYHNPLPLYIDNFHTGCPPEQCSYILMFVSNGDVPTHDVDYPFVLPITNENVRGLRIRRRDIVAWYVATKSISNYTPETMSISGGMISGNLRAGLTYENHKDYYSYIPEINKNLEIIQPMELYEYVAGLVKSKITQQHHFFVNKQEIAVVYEKYLKDAESQHLTAVNEVLHIMINRAADLGLDNRVSFITHLLYIMVAPTFAVYHLLNMMRVSESYKHYYQLLKNESCAAKQSQTVFRDDLAVIYEMQVLFNRVFDDVDWSTERQHRVESETVPIPFEIVFSIASNIFKSGLLEGKRPLRLDWDTYWKTRWSSMPSGSIVSQYEQDLAVKRSLPLEAKNKSSWFAAIGNSDHTFWENRKPEIYATTSTKYEWGKVRALYGCDVTSFLHADYSMNNVEDTLPSYFPVGKLAKTSYVEGCVHKFKDSVPVCFDYDDFNSQHSISSMQAVMQAWIETYQHLLTDEQNASAAWTRDSIANMYVNFNELNETVAINGTLMSGWRLTSFMNTVLNRVYLVYAGLEKNLVYSLHNGDDMFGGAPTMHNALSLIKNAKELGIRAQVSKTNLGTIGEFLRVDTRAKNPTMSQYLARAVATLVHGRVEADSPTDLAAFVTATSVRCDQVTSRGGGSSLMKVLFDKIMEFASRLFRVDYDIIENMLDTHPVQGGLNKDARVRELKIVRVAIDKKDTDYYDNKYSSLSKGIDDYIDVIKDQFNLSESEISRNHLKIKAYSSLERDLIRYETGVESDERIFIYRGLYGAWKGTGFIAPIAKIRSMGLIAAKQLRTLSSVPASLIRNAVDPIKFMSVIF